MSVSTKVIVWEKAKQLINTGQLDRLARDPECTRRYREHKRSLQGVDVCTYVLSRLQWSSEELDYLNSCKFKADQDKIDAALSERSFYRITKNDFPYNFEPNVHHLVIWSKIVLPLYKDDSNGATQDPQMHDRIEAFLKHNLQDRLHVSKNDYCWFVNYSSLQSIKKISHIHLLIRTDDNELIERKILGEQDFEPLQAPRSQSYDGYHQDGAEKT